MLRVQFIFFVSCGLVVVSCNNSDQKITARETHHHSIDSSLLNNLAEKATDTNMIRIEGGSFEMGTDNAEFPDAQPVHKVEVNGFWMDEHDDMEKSHCRQTIACLPVPPGTSIILYL